MQYQKEIDEYIEKHIGKRYRDADISKYHEFIRDDYEQKNKLTDWIKKPKDFLVILGPPGTGKTHFCAALFRLYYPKMRSEIRYMRERNLYSYVQSWFHLPGYNAQECLLTLADTYFMMIDDIGSDGQTDWRDGVLYDFVDNRYNSQMPTVFTSNLLYDDFKNNYDDRIVSRLFSKDSTIIYLNNERDHRAYV